MFEFYFEGFLGKLIFEYYFSYFSWNVLLYCVMNLNSNYVKVWIIDKCNVLGI